MLALDLNMLSLALLGASAVAFARRRTLVLIACGAFFMASAALATLAVYWPTSPEAAVMLLAAGEGLPLAALVLYLVDRAFAPFCVEMTYALLICWVLWPLLVLANFVGLLA